MTLIIDIPMNEGKDALLSATTGLGIPGVPELRASRPIPLHHGMGKGEKNWQFINFRNRLYVTNNESRPRVWDGTIASKASLSPPSGVLRSSVERKKVRLSSEGAAYPDAHFGHGGAGTHGSAWASAANNLTILNGSWTPSAADIGKVLIIPTFAGMGDFGGAPTGDGPSYIGTIEAIVSTTVVQITPALDATQRDLAAAGSYFAFQVFDDAVEELPESTPYSDRRLIPSGGCEPWMAAVGNDDLLSAGKENAHCLNFQGSHGLVAAPKIDRIGPDIVIDFKCYLRPERLETGLDGRISLWERRNDPDTGSWELAIVRDGHVRFRFYDTKKGAWRSIQSVGKVLTEGEWYYLRFRYRYKRTGGWQPDDRWINQSATGVPILSRHRDALSVWACEGKNPADPFLILPGCHCSFDDDQSAANAWTINKSHELGNVGYLLEDPWIGPRDGDPAFYWPAGWQDQPAVAYKLTLAASAAGAGPDAGHRIWLGTMVAATNMWLPRWWSRNRDIGLPTQAIDGEIAEDDIGSTGPNYYPPADAAGGHLSAGLQRGAERAVLLYVYGLDGAGERFASPRILAVRDIDTFDIGNVDAWPASSNTATLHVSDDPALGGDGLGAGALGAGTYVVAFALPNGKNHSANATGNRTALPTLLVQGENPVGHDDSPADEEAPVRMFGSAGTSKPDNAALGFDGQFEDAGFLISELTELEQGTDTVYTPDMMAPDPVFYGPVDTRVFSLPPLQFDQSATSQPFQQDLNDASGTPSSPTWCSRLDTPTRGPDVDQEVGAVGGSIVQDGYKIARQGKHLLAVTYYDPDQGVESPPSEIAELDVEAEEGADGTPDPMDASFRLVADIIPLCGDRDRPRLWRRVYQSLAGGSPLFLSAEIRDNRTSRVDLSPSLTWLVNQPTLDWLRAEPPVCRAILATEQRVIFGGLREAPQAIAWSDAFRPWSVLRTSREIVESRDGSPVTALGYLLGRTFVFQRDAAFSLDFVRTGPESEAARIHRIQGNTGAVGPTAVVEYDDALFFRAEKGVYMVDTSLRSVYVSPMMEGSFRELDPEGLPPIAGCYDRTRNQVLFSSQEKALSFPKRIYSFEIPDSPYAQQAIPIGSLLSHHEGITALLAGDDPGTEAQVIYAGTMLGFVEKLDQETAARGTEPGFGDLEVSVVSAVQATITVEDATGLALDPTGDGLVGCPVLFARNTTLTLADGSTEIVERPVLSGSIVKVEVVSGTQARLYLAEAQSSVLAGDTAYIGGWVRRWRSKVFGLEKFVRTERRHMLDSFFVPESGGLLQLAVWLERDGTTPEDIQEIEMDTGEALLSTPYRSVFFQFEVSRHGLLRPMHVHLLGYRALLETQHA